MLAPGRPGAKAWRRPDRPLARLQRPDGVLAHRRIVQAGKSRRRRHGAGLLLRREQLRDLGARRDAHRRAGPFRERALVGRRDPARSPRRRRHRGRRDRGGRESTGLPRHDRRFHRVGAIERRDPGGRHRARFAPATRSSGRTRHGIWARRSAAQAPSRSSTFPGCTRMRHAGSPRRARSRRSASTPRASTTDSRRCTSRIGCCTSATSRRSRI